MSPEYPAPLLGRCIAVPESRELDVFARLLERRGASVYRCPLVAIRDAPDPAPVLTWLQGFIEGHCDLLILYTGEGLSRLLNTLDRHAPSQRTAFLQRLASTPLIARGPKPVRVLRELGLSPTHIAEPATTAGILTVLEQLPLQHRRVGVQWYGGEPVPALEAALQAAGACILPVAPYIYADQSEDSQVLQLIEGLHCGRIDAIAFTSAQQLERLFRVAVRHQRDREWRQAMNRTLVAAVGPVVAAGLRKHGIQAKVIPADRYYLKPLTQALIAYFTPHPA